MAWGGLCCPSGLSMHVWLCLESPVGPAQPSHCSSALQTSAQQALMGTITSSMHAVQQAQSDLSQLDTLPPLGQDMVSSEH